MPAALSYPGVYIEEVPSGVRTITGVATSITAFVGRALRGIVDSDEKSPVRLSSYPEFERRFGGLSNDCPMSFAVQHYFNNGGGDALIVRVHNGATPSKLGMAGSLQLEAADPGTWGDQLRVRIDVNIDQDIADRNPPKTIFNLRVKDLATGATETYLNVSIRAGHPRFVSQVLFDQSRLLRCAPGIANLPAANQPAPAAAKDPFDHPSASALTGGHDGNPIGDAQVASGAGLQAAKRGLFALEKADLFNLLVIPPFSEDADVVQATWTAAVAYCAQRRAMLLVDPPFHVGGWNAVNDVTKANNITSVVARSANAALFFPRLRIPNPLRESRPEAFAPSGAVAGVIARTDAQRGVWKAPAGIEATLNGVLAPDVSLTDPENGNINPLGVNCIRSFPNTGSIVWGSRTLRGADTLASEWKYLPVRRMALFLEESLYRGTQWVVFEPNDEPLWSQIRLNIGAFMQNLFRQGAFQGKSPKDAYFVRCDNTTTTQTDINLGIVNIVVGFAPLKPAEFVVLKLQQIAGDIPT